MSNISLRVSFFEIEETAANGNVEEENFCHADNDNERDLFFVWIVFEE